MKTFTLRLTDDEAEALERMTFIENETRPGGQSKNKFIEELIAKEYAEYEHHAVINNKIKFVTPAYGFAAALYEATETYCLDNNIALAAIEYAKNNIPKDPEADQETQTLNRLDIISALNEMRESIIEEIKRTSEANN